MMKLACVVLVILACQSYAEEQTYTTKYDGIDLDEILASSRLLTGYVNCLLDLRPCTPDGKELKHNLPDAISNDCSKCTERQQQGADKVMHYIIDQRPEDWEKLEKKYNSDGSYKQKYLQSKVHKDETTEEKLEGETNETKNEETTEKQDK